MTSKKFYIADEHFWHEGALAYDNRPYKTAEEMNENLIQRWNSVVSEDDTVYSLGDMFFCGSQKAMPIIDRLNGKKVLIRGNHDKIFDKNFKDKFDHITSYEEIEDGGRHVVLCHYPIPCFKRHHMADWYHLYGHVHNTFELQMMEHDRFLMENLYEKPCQMYCVCGVVPYMNYTPRTLDEIISGYNAAHDKFVIFGEDTKVD